MSQQGFINRANRANMIFMSVGLRRQASACYAQSNVSTICMSLCMTSIHVWSDINLKYL